jgi:hypothetical protein
MVVTDRAGGKAWELDDGWSVEPEPSVSLRSVPMQQAPSAEPSPICVDDGWGLPEELEDSIKLDEMKPAKKTSAKKGSARSKKKRRRNQNKTSTSKPAQAKSASAKKLEAKKLEAKKPEAKKPEAKKPEARVEPVRTQPANAREIHKPAAEQAPVAKPHLKVAEQLEAKAEPESQPLKSEVDLLEASVIVDSAVMTSELEVVPEAATTTQPEQKVQEQAVEDTFNAMEEAFFAMGEDISSGEVEPSDHHEIYAEDVEDEGGWWSRLKRRALGVVPASE